MAVAVQAMRPGPIGQPDIDYAPNLEKYQARVKRRTESEQLATSLPQGFPSRLDSPLVWDGADITTKYNWVYELNEDEVAEIEAALRHFKCVFVPSVSQR